MRTTAQISTPWLGGLEKVLGDLPGATKAAKELGKRGLLAGLKQTGWNVATEIPEELVTELSQAVNDRYSQVDAEALEPDRLVDMVAQTVAQTVLSVGMASSPGLVARAGESIADDRARRNARKAERQAEKSWQQLEAKLDAETSADQGGPVMDDGGPVPADLSGATEAEPGDGTTIGPGRPVAAQEGDDGADVTLESREPGNVPQGPARTAEQGVEDDFAMREGEFLPVRHIADWVKESLGVPDLVANFEFIFNKRRERKDESFNSPIEVQFFTEEVMSDPDLLIHDRPEQDSYIAVKKVGKYGLVAVDVGAGKVRSAYRMDSDRKLGEKIKRAEKEGGQILVPGASGPSIVPSSTTLLSSAIEILRQRGHDVKGLERYAAGQREDGPGAAREVYDSTGATQSEATRSRSGPAGPTDSVAREGEIGQGVGEEVPEKPALFTPGARLQDGVATRESDIPFGFEISTPEGAKATALTNATFGEGDREATRGMLDVVEVPESQRGQGVGTSLARDAIGELQRRGARTVVMVSVTEEGKALERRLRQEGVLGAPVAVMRRGELSSPRRLQDGEVVTEADGILEYQLPEQPTQPTRQEGQALETGTPFPRVPEGQQEQAGDAGQAAQPGPKEFQSRETPAERSGVPEIPGREAALDESPGGWRRRSAAWNSGQETVGRRTLSQGLRSFLGQTQEKVVQAIAHVADVAQNIQGARRRGVVYREVDKNEAQALRDRTGIELGGYVHIVDSFGVRHALRQHGQETTEAPRGQEPISKADVLLLPEVTRPENLVSMDQNDRGQDAFIYEKQVNGHIVVVEEVRTGRKELAFVTMWKRKSKERTTDEAMTTEARASKRPGTTGSNPSLLGGRGGATGVPLDRSPGDSTSETTSTRPLPSDNVAQGGRDVNPQARAYASNCALESIFS